MVRTRRARRGAREAEATPTARTPRRRAPARAKTAASSAARESTGVDRCGRIDVLTRCARAWGWTTTRVVIVVVGIVIGVALALFLVGVASRAAPRGEELSSFEASAASALALERALASVVRDDFTDASRFFMDDLVRTRASSKAPVMLLVARDAEALGSARERLVEATRGERCAMTFDCGSREMRAMATDEARGTIQRELVMFFKRCTARGAMVVLHDVGRLGLATVPSLLPALSEDGAYAYDGESIRTTHGVFLLTAELPSAYGDDERTFTRSAKGALGDALRSGEADAEATALAFRRRIDVAAPMNS